MLALTWRYMLALRGAVGLLPHGEHKRRRRGPEARSCTRQLALWRRHTHKAAAIDDRVELSLAP